MTSPIVLSGQAHTIPFQSSEVMVHPHFIDALHQQAANPADVGVVFVLCLRMVLGAEGFPFGDRDVVNGRAGRLSIHHSSPLFMSPADHRPNRSSIHSGVKAASASTTSSAPTWRSWSAPKVVLTPTARIPAPLA